ncbi:MAG: hypothetical protein WKG07_04470 [Hymenobacter sp.]
MEEAPVRALLHEGGYLTHLALADGRQVPLTALYLQARHGAALPLPPCWAVPSPKPAT